MDVDKWNESDRIWDDDYGLLDEERVEIRRYH